MQGQNKFDEKQFVKQNYEKIYKNFIATIPDREKLYDIPPVEFFIDQVKKFQDKKVIQLGCGDGIPLGTKLIQNKIEYSAVEYCENLHAMAKQNMKSRADFIYHAQMVKYCKALPDGCFSGVVSLFAIKHLTPSEQVQLFMQVHRILVKDGIFMLNTLQDHIGIDETFQGVQKTFGIVKDFLGKPNYNAFLPADWYVKTLQVLGFEILNKYTGQNGFNNIIEHPIYLVFRRKTIISIQGK